jgi:hypothetical protein
MRTPTVALAWPEVLTDITTSLACEYATLTREGRPVTWPVTPYAGERTLDVSTGLTYPLKAERARRDPRVALSFSDPTGYASRAGSGVRPPVVVVEGLATVRDADLQANTDRYVREALAKTGSSGAPWFVARTWAWYYARIWVEVTPLRVTWWPEGDFSAAPETWTAAAGTTAPASDRPPTRAASRDTAHTGAAEPTPGDWRPFADRAERLGAPVVTMTRDGSPLPVRARSVRRTVNGFHVTLPVGVDPTVGQLCLTFHRVTASPRFTQENVVLLGHGTPDGDGLAVTVDRAVNDWSLSGGRVAQARDWLRQGARRNARLAEEAARRGQPVPVVRRTR